MAKKKKVAKKKSVVKPEKKLAIKGSFIDVINAAVVDKNKK